MEGQLPHRWSVYPGRLVKSKVAERSVDTIELEALFVCLFICLFVCWNSHRKTHMLCRGDDENHENK